MFDISTESRKVMEYTKKGYGIHQDDKHRPLMKQRALVKHQSDISIQYAERSPQLNLALEQVVIPNNQSTMNKGIPGSLVHFWKLSPGCRCGGISKTPGMY